MEGDLDVLLDSLAQLEDNLNTKHFLLVGLRGRGAPNRRVKEEVNPGPEQFKGEGGKEERHFRGEDVHMHKLSTIFIF